MAVGNTTQDYGTASKAMHWLVVALIAAMFVIAWTMEDLQQPLRGQMVDLHKSIGATIIALGVIRIAMSILQAKPAPLGELPQIMHLAAKAGHGLLLLWLIVMPLSGWVMMSAFGRPVSVFGMFTLPDLVAPDREFGRTVREVHEVLATLGLILIGAHVAAAIWHHVILKDGTLRRMLPGRSA